MPGWVSAPQAHSRVSNINFDISKKNYGREVSINIPWKIYRRTPKFLPAWGFKSKVISGPFNWLKCLGGISASQAHSRVSNINFDIWIYFLWRGVSYKYPIRKIALRTAKFLARLGFQVKHISRAFNWLKCLGGYSAPQVRQQSVKYQLCYWFFFFGERVLYKYPMKNISKDGKVLDHLGV